MRKILHRRLVDEDVGDELFMPTNTIPIPIIVNIIIIATYVGMGAVVFSQWEGWNTMSAAYFSFVTLTTIGFGDLVPINSFQCLYVSNHCVFPGQRLKLYFLQCNIVSSNLFNACTCINHK